jgi:ribonuclease HI
MKVYVVFEGKKPGVYKTWNECLENTKGVKGSKFKGYPTEKEGNEALEKYTSHDEISTEDENNSISTDVGTSGNPGKTEFRVVETSDSKIIFNSKLYELGTNNIGEFLGVVWAMKYLKERNEQHRIIFTDSKTAMSWITKKAYKTSLERNAQTEEIYQEMEKSIKWLKENNTEDFKLQKWNTLAKGQIKADYNRK